MSETWSAFALLAEHHGFAADPARPGTWSGGVRGALVRFEVVPVSTVEAGVRVVVPLGRAGLVIASTAHALTEQGRRLTGDHAFDEVVWLADPDPTIHGFLDAPRRSRLAEIVRHGAHAQGGELRLEPWANLDPDLVEAVVEAMAEAAHALATTSRASAIEALVRIATSDPLRTVRAACRAVADLAPDVRDALAAAAASVIEGPNDEAFAELAQQIQDIALPPHTRGKGIARMLDLFPLAHCEPILAELPSEMEPALVRALVQHLRTAEADTTTGLRLIAPLVDPRRILVSDDDRIAVADLVGELRDELALELCATLGTSDEPRVFEAALGAMMRLPVTADEVVQSLGDRGILDRALGLAPEVARVVDGASGELLAAFYERVPERSLLRIAYLETFGVLRQAEWAPLALDALDAPDDDVKIAAIDALAAIGGPTAVAALRGHTAGIFRAARLKDRARRAIEAIEARVGDTGPLAGGLALASSASGRLAVSEEGLGGRRGRAGADEA